MDKLTKYRESVQALMARYELIMDTVRDHYQWMNVGWQKMERIYNCYIHIDIIDGKVWLQQNWTEENPAEDLVALGVPREDIVLGLHAPYKRPYTDYGVA
jgi:XisI protein